MRPMHVLPALLIAAALVGCGGDGDDDGGNGGGATSPPAQTSQPARTNEPARTTAPAVDGAEVFASAGCGSCHVLAAADAGGVTGPDLDDLQPSVEEVRSQVIDGGGGMPSFEGDLSTEEIDAVSTYVADNAGR
ncbi:MAG TPA: cytochrome c [Conexibacter sp.]|nr:cytochrome c [Conexibacter sp.]